LGKRKHPKRETTMVPVGKIDALIEAGWRVLESDFDEDAFQQWRMRAYECLKALLGPHHTYTEQFQYNMRHPATITLLSGVGVLAAVSLGGLHGDFPDIGAQAANPDGTEPLRSAPAEADVCRLN